jgi:hypothetical protein
MFFRRQVTSDSESARDAVRLRYQNRELEVEVEELRITHGKTETVS